MSFLTFLLLAISLNRLGGTEVRPPPIFPFAEFFKIKTSALMTYPRYTCDTQADVDRDCSCREDCMHYGDCCIDYLWTSAMIPQHLDKYVTIFKRTFDEARSDLDCEKFETKLPDGLDGFKFYFMKSTCPGGTAIELERKCTDIDGELPVLVSGNTFLYKNMFCAQCNLEVKFEKINYIITCQGKLIRNLADIWQYIFLRGIPH